MSRYEKVYLLESVQSVCEGIVFGFWLENRRVAIWKCLTFLVSFTCPETVTKKRKKLRRKKRRKKNCSKE